MKKYIPIQILNYQFDDAENIVGIVVGFNLYQGENYVNSQILLTNENIKTINANAEISKLNFEQCNTYARRLIREWYNVSKAIDAQPPRQNKFT